MKKFKIFALSTLVVVIGIIACKKEAEIQQETKNTSFDYKVTTNLPYSSIKTINKSFKGENGSDLILWFPDMPTFKFVMKELKRQLYEYDSVFISQFSNLGIEAINAKAEEIGYNEEKPLVDFADFYSFNSLHKAIIDQENIFLQQENPDIENDPDNHFIIEDEIRALLNTDCEVKINDTIYKLTEEGYYAICDGNLKSLEILNNSNGNLHTLPDVLFFEGNSKAEGCNSNKRNADYKKSDNNKYRIKWVVSHWTHPWDRRCIAKIDNYYYKGAFLNKWVKQKANSYCKVYGYISNIDNQGNANCDEQLNFNPQNTGSYANAVKSWEHRIDVQTKTRSGWVKATFIGINGITHNQTLTW